MLHDFENDGGGVALKWAAEDREGWRHRERMSESWSTDDDKYTRVS